MLFIVSDKNEIHLFLSINFQPKKTSKKSAATKEKEAAAAAAKETKEVAEKPPKKAESTSTPKSKNSEKKKKNEEKKKEKEREKEKEKEKEAEAALTGSKDLAACRYMCFISCKKNQFTIFKLSFIIVVRYRKKYFYSSIQNMLKNVTGYVC